ncbi:glutamate N-acetyltransferase/amino-acid acetyltransferase [Clostridium thermobutyricum]|uniref:Arginine biosynthesis bifunctional protein ArgJ n=1 Tax=Clostridium thermobutyricum TaxID=29372 RepID=N9Y394_9CLOT|nr:bifunctional glutamate N-acetyltransferase/amino-acid acetyltransferase ArgJ [Clostridium thermobutyricum]ENZ02629.1 glutamate N-acetyltransferase/amino-acid acetyltransferase [Clostridium thermobutyricum]
MKIIENGSITTPKGFKASGVHCGLKKSKKDLALIYSEVKCNAAGVYTNNIVKGAPIYVTKEHLKDGTAQAIIINSGNANTCNGEIGIQDAKAMAYFASFDLHLKPEDILVASTGIIGVPLNLKLIINSCSKLALGLSYDSSDAASAILTTDTRKKECAVSFTLSTGEEVKIGSICKGSGMIEPNMGTMLSFISTDINISKNLLNEALKKSVEKTYNRISVDGDTSTNDMVLILANKLSGNNEITEKNKDYFLFLDALTKLNLIQAKRIASDGEGATKLIECTVCSAPSVTDAITLSKSVINSSLVKTAIFGSDANWGRILCALGYSKINFNPNKISVSFKSTNSEIEVYKEGMGLKFNETKAKEILIQDTIEIIINMNSGNSSATCFGCDLTYDYVKINGDYRS